MATSDAILSDLAVIPGDVAGNGLVRRQPPERRSVMVVEVEPVWQGLEPLVVGAIGAGVGPLAKQRLDEPFDLAIWSADGRVASACDACRAARAGIGPADPVRHRMEFGCPRRLQGSRVPLRRHAALEPPGRCPCPFSRIGAQRDWALIGYGRARGPRDSIFAGHPSEHTFLGRRVVVSLLRAVMVRCGRATLSPPRAGCCPGPPSTGSSQSSWLGCAADPFRCRRGPRDGRPHPALTGSSRRGEPTQCVAVIRRSAPVPTDSNGRT